MLLLVSGNWHTLARLESELGKRGPDDTLLVTVRRTEQRTVREDQLPYAVDVVCLDHAGIVSNLAGFFAARDIEIAELTTRSYAAAHTGAPMFSVQMSVNIPSRLHISALREEFMNAQIGVNSTQNQTGDERPQQKAKGFHKRYFLSVRWKALAARSVS